MPVCFILNIRTGILNASKGSVRFGEYPYQYSGRLRRGREFISVNTRINIPNASGGAMAGAFVLVKIRISIPNAPGGFRA